MYTQTPFSIKAIIEELNQKHKLLMAMFPKFSVDYCLLCGSKPQLTGLAYSESPVLRIRIHHNKVLPFEPFLSDELFDWCDIDKFEQFSMSDFDQVFLVFTTPEIFDKELVPKHLLNFTQNYSDSNKFQIQHHLLDTSNNLQY